MRILLGGETRFEVNAQLIQENFHTAWVALRNGDIIKRKKLRDFVDFIGDKAKEISNRDRLYYTHPAEKVLSNRKLSWFSRFINWVTSLFRGPKEKNT